MATIFGRDFDINFGSWEIDGNGVHKGEGQTYRSASPIPIVPVTILTNTDSRTEKIEIVFHKYNRWQSIIVPRSSIASKTTIVKLADSGVEVNSENAKNMVLYLAEMISANIDRIPKRDAKSVMGWIGDEFAPYTDSIVFDGDENYKHLYSSISTKGTLEEWVEFCSPLRKNLQLRLMMAASFASPIIERVGENPFVLHLYGSSGTAKTVSLLVAMSIWGNPAMGELTRTMNMTNNSMLTTAAFLRNLPFAGDELQTIKSRWANYDQLIMQLTEGIDRARMSFDRLNEVRSWKCSFIFTGEENCVKEGSGGGVANRVISIEIDGKLVENGNATANFVRSHYGCAGEKFVDVIRNTDCKSLYAEYFNSIMNNSEINTTDKQAGAMSMILAGDELARRTFWTDEEPIRIEDIKDYMIPDNSVDVSERAYRYICDTIAGNSIRFEKGNKECWGSQDGEEEPVYFISRYLVEALETGGFDFSSVKKKWIEKGYIVNGTDGHPRRIKKINGSVASCYCIKLPDEPSKETASDDDITYDQLPF